MFGSPRVIAVDDNRRHLDGLVGGIHRSGIACLAVHFPDDVASTERCPDVRVIFADLNLVEGAGDETVQFGAMGGLLEDTIGPRGPYFIVLWTQYPEQATKLKEFLNRLTTVTKPLGVIPLAKAEHLDIEGDVQDEGKLVAAVRARTRKFPAVAALIDWETCVLGAAGATVSALMTVASTDPSSDRAAELKRVLSCLGIAAVGKEHVHRNRFRAVNEALLPILADRIGNLRSGSGDDTSWREALAPVAESQALSLEEAARLNGMVHVDVGSGGGGERGMVVTLPAKIYADFAAWFGGEERAIAEKQFHCKGFAAGDARFRWVLVQCQAACDYAQSRPGPTPCYLGLEMPYPRAKNGQPPAALWRSPELQVEGEVRQLRVSAQFPVSIGAAEFHGERAIYRLREQILHELIYTLHSHGARPGMLSFRGK